MVDLLYPDSSTTRFIIWNGFGFGPYDGNLKYTATTIPLENKFFKETRGIYGENGVDHAQSTGSIEYSPVLSDCIISPAYLLPRRLKVPIVPSGYVYINEGFASNGATKTWLADSDTSRVTFGFRRLEIGWRIFEIKVYLSKPTKVYSCVYYDLWDIAWVNTTTAKYKVTYNIQSRTNVDFGKDVSKPLTMDDIDFIVAAYGLSGWTKQTFTTSSTPIYNVRYSQSKSPTVLVDDINAFIRSMVETTVPINRMDWGDLAAKAVQNKRAVRTNMIAFFRDLKDIKSLVPKLKGLLQLKTAANNYLAVKYGILPTVSDLKKIVAAFQQRKQFFDKNGFSCYNAKHTAVAEDGTFRYDLEQRIKVAIAEEDSSFDKLIDQFDSLGLFPTYENIWDLLPYSFVVDWFVQIGDLLERVDNCQRLMRYNIRYVTMSESEMMSGMSSGTSSFPFMGQIKWSSYRRWVTDHCPLPPLTLTASPTVSDHWLEAGALIIQRSK